MSCKHLLVEEKLVCLLVSLVDIDGSNQDDDVSKNPGWLKGYSGGDGYLAERHWVQILPNLFGVIQVKNREK